MVRTAETKLEKISKKSANSHFHILAEKHFLNRIQQVEEFIKTNGSGSVENITTKDTIYNFVAHQKRNMARGKTPEWKKKELTAVGVSGYKSKSEKMKDDFEKGMKLLEEYKMAHGHCYVPTVRYKKGEKNKDFLKLWAMKYRKRKNKLQPDELKRLNDIGFVWELNDGLLCTHIQEQNKQNTN